MKNGPKREKRGDLRNIMHSAPNSQQPYDEMHQGHRLNIKFEFPQTGK